MQIRDMGALYAYVGDHAYAGFTAERLGNALRDFRLPLVEGASIDWLATAVRRILSMVTPAPGGMPENLLSNADKREKLAALAGHLKAVWDEIDKLENDTLAALSAGMNDSSWESFSIGLDYLKFMGEAVDDCATGLVKDGAKWRSTAKRAMRVRQAWYLSPVYTQAFGRQPTWTDPRGDGASDNGPWADFYQRVILVAEGESIPDLRGVLKEARNRHKTSPVCYPETFIPSVR